MYYNQLEQLVVLHVGKCFDLKEVYLGFKRPEATF